MFLLRESLWWVLISGAIGYFCGWGKGRAGAGLLLGPLFGPFGCLAIMLFPPAARRPMRTVFRGPGPQDAPDDPSGCPRCRKPVARKAKACPHCGNVLMPIRNAVEGGGPVS
jgi:hypothetical protein